MLNTGSRKALQNLLKIKYLQVGSYTEVEYLGSIEARKAGFHRPGN